MFPSKKHHVDEMVVVFDCKVCELDSINLMPGATVSSSFGVFSSYFHTFFQLTLCVLINKKTPSSFTNPIICKRSFLQNLFCRYRAYSVAEFNVTVIGCTSQRLRNIETKHRRKHLKSFFQFR